MREFNERQIRFLESTEECRLATSHDDVPHVKPVQRRAVAHMLVRRGRGLG